MRVQEEVVSEIDVKQAVQRAKDFAVDLYRNEKISRLGLEAIERTEDGKYWLVTLGFSRLWSRSKSRKHPLDEVLRNVREPQSGREYKVFKVDAQSGSVLGMEMLAE